MYTFTVLFTPPSQTGVRDADENLLGRALARPRTASMMRLLAPFALLLVGGACSCSHRRSCEEGDMPGPTCWAIHGVAQTCPQLAAQGYCLLSSLGCDVVDACPYSCEACTTRKFCDVSEHNGQHTGFADGVTGIDLTCAELAPSFCTAKTSQGKLVRFWWG